MTRITRLSLLLGICCAAFLSACASQRTNSTVELIPPELHIDQVRTTAYAAKNITGPVTVNYNIQIVNKSGESITLKQIKLETIGQGAYVLPPSQRPYDRLLVPDKPETLGFWANAQAPNTILGVNGPVTIRATAYFSSSAGEFQKIYMQALNDGMGDQPSPLQ